MSQSDFLAFRQIHLDFHTSEYITNIGAEFDAEQFADTLAKAHVNSVTCFARCHHGWLYYPSKVFPERIHPHLKAKNLLGEQIEACHARGIRAPIYITVQWDYYTATRHPEWLALDEDGRIQGTEPYEAGFYNYLCLNSPYVDFLKAQTKEVLETFPCDGFFFDIVFPVDDSSRWTRMQMEERGLDVTDAKVRQAFGLTVLNTFKQDMTAFVRKFNKDCTIFYNRGHVGPRHRSVKDAYSHFELESLPSGGWGYLHFPITMRYARTLGIDCVSHTGKFHTSWGDFHSYKNKEALEFECFRMLALGSKCEIGDQLHPNGVLDKPSYDLIGPVYAEVEKKEPWCRGAKAVSEIAVFTPEEFGSVLGRDLAKGLEGLTHMFDESALQFDIVDSQADLSSYKVVILPDDIPVNKTLNTKLSRFVKDGGAVIASFASGIDSEKQAVTLDLLGVKLTKSDAPEMQGKVFERGDYAEYLRPKKLLGNGIIDADYVMYIKGMAVKAEKGTTVLADGIKSYFDRTYQHFCSHRQTPSSSQKGTPAITQNGKVIYFAHPIFSQYRQNAPRWCKQLFLNALARVLPTKLIEHNGPSTVLVTLTEQKAKKRYIVHLLHYIPERRGLDFDVIEDVIPLYNLGLTLHLPQKIKSARLVPQEEGLEFTVSKNQIRLTVPELNGHQMIELA